MAMIIPPFTYNEAERIAQRNQRLVGKEYLCGESKQVYNIRSVGVWPFFEYDKLYLSHMYMLLLLKVEGFTVDTIIDFLSNDKSNAYDVALTCRPTENNAELMAVKSIDTIATKKGLTYRFNIHLL